jgi:hypothetical protein
VTDSRCVRCSAPTDATLCWPCIEKLADTLKVLADLLPELRVTVSGQAKTSRGIVHRAAHEPTANTTGHGEATVTRVPLPWSGFALVSTALPFNPEAAELQTEARRTLTRLVAELAAGHGIYVHAGTAAHPEAAVAWLRRNLRTIVRRDPQAGAVSSRLRRLRLDVEQAVDNRAADMYAGPCDAPDTGPSGRICGVDLYSRLGDRTVVCQACGARYDVAERREWLVEAARAATARPTVIAAALTAWSMPLTAERLDKWISRDKARYHPDRPWPMPYPPIMQVETDYQDENGADVMEPLLDRAGQPVLADGVPVLKQAGHPMYRVGDVIDRVVWTMTSEANKQARARLEPAS